MHQETPCANCQKGDCANCTRQQKVNDPCCLETQAFQEVQA